MMMARRTEVGTGQLPVPAVDGSGRGLFASMIASAALTAVLLLQTGCVPLLVAGAATGAMATFDRRTFGAQTEDQSIELRAASRFPEAARLQGSVSVTSFNRKVLLTGQVTDERTRSDVEAAVAGMANVNSVHNELVIGAKNTLAGSGADSTMTAQIRAALIEARDLQSNAFKVVTERGTVYLMGLVTKREGDRAAMVASRVRGVQRVVTVFEYLSEDELARIERRSDRQ
jgi:osmotically-inducible protein OsmY